MFFDNCAGIQIFFCEPGFSYGNLFALTVYPNKTVKYIAVDRRPITYNAAWTHASAAPKQERKN